MDDNDFRPVLAELATGVWRLRGKLADGESAAGEGTAKLLRSLARQVDSMADALTEAGVQVQSHTGEPFDAGQSVQVIAFTPSPAVRRETVVETITPTVYVGGRLAQLGEIVVATPEVPGAPEDPAAQTVPKENDESLDG
jgi:hypothetical protein